MEDEKDQTQWYTADVREDKQFMSGLVHRSRLKWLSSFSALSLEQQTKPPLAYQTFSGHGFVVEIVTAPFDFAKNKAKFATSKTTQGFIEKYQGQEIWGTDGMAPNEHYQKISISRNQEVITLPAAAYANLFQPNPSTHGAYFDAKNNTLYLTAENGDGAGSYAVVWIIKNNRYAGRKLYLSSWYDWEKSYIMINS